MRHLCSEILKNDRGVAELRDLNIYNLNLSIHFVCAGVFYLIDKLLLIIILLFFLIFFIVNSAVCQLYCRRKIVL